MNTLILAGVGGVVLVGALAGGGVWLHSDGFDKGTAACEAAHNKADLEAFQANTNKLASLGTALAAAADKIAQEKPQIIKEYHRETVRTPLPATCVIDAGRLRALGSAFGSTPASAGAVGKPVPATPAVQ